MAEQRMQLVVMRASDMLRVHPRTDWTRRCGSCGEPVGIYPSGQRVLAEHGDLVNIICNRCTDSTTGTLAPGAEHEPAQSVWNPRVRRP